MRHRFVILALSASLWMCNSMFWRMADAITLCRAVALGDLDGDGDLDAFLANGRHENVAPNTVWFNDGGGRLRDSGQRLGSNDSQSVALGDLDGDGDLDVLLSHSWAPPGGEVLENNGRGGFISRQWLGGPEGLSGIRAVVLGDLDGDQDLDLFMSRCGAASGPSHLVWFNDGWGGFRDSGQWIGTLGSYGAALGDLDSDGDLDAFVANWPQSPETVWLNDGLGRYSDSGQQMGNWRALDVALGDVDGDGDLDALLGNEGPDEVWLNDGAGGFANSGQALSDGRTWEVVLADFDMDGDLDALEQGDESGEIWLNDGMGRFLHHRQTLPSRSSGAVALGDMDGDGDPDTVVARGIGRPQVWLNDGTGRFVPPNKIWIWAGLGAVAVVASASGLWWLRRRRPPSEVAVDRG